MVTMIKTLKRNNNLFKGYRSSGMDKLYWILLLYDEQWFDRMLPVEDLVTRQTIIVKGELFWEQKAPEASEPAVCWLME